ncbi:MAG: hypothetical protein HQ488_05405 [Parcubacteria group bacterium]|nr:hypothetical protein [Parcubacteria group bacterium]
MSDKPKSVLDVLAWCQSLENRLSSVEQVGEIIIDFGEERYEADSLLSSGENKARTHTVKIKYKEQFKKVLQVIPTIQRIDTDGNYSSRFEIKADNVTTSGFDLIIGTWEVTKIWDISVKWYAIGYGELAQ